MVATWIGRITALILLTGAVATPFLQTSPVAAVTASDWKAGRIIDDNIFTNANSMSVTEIQNFLNSKVPSCDTNGTQPASEYGRPDLTHAQYAASRGWPAPPYVCLRNYYEVPKTEPGAGTPANNYGGSIPSGAVSAAQMIYNAAQKYSISPKVLLVMIQKESAGPLTTDTWPLQSQYTYAMGAHCPDSGPGGSANCDANYAGFSLQIAESAALMRWYLDSMDQSWWQYKKPYQTNSILWNVATTGCGAGNVYIESKATAALYTYTPYQPNSAALSNMYGTGNGCSAYGNRNFWRIYNDWFGNTINTALSATLNSVKVYSNSSKTTELGLTPTISPGQTIYVTVSLKNTGSQTWKQDVTKIGTLSPENRYSQFTDSSWLASGRAARLTESSVSPGSSGTFEFSMTAPNLNGSYSEEFGLLAEGVMWFGPSLTINPTVSSPYNGVVTQLRTYSDAGYTQRTDTRNLAAGKTAYVEVQIKNTGTQTWTQSLTKIGTTNPDNRGSAFQDSSWLAWGRAAQLSQANVSPGGTGTFRFSMTAPSIEQTYAESFGLVTETVAWHPGVSFTLNFNLYSGAENRINANAVIYSGEYLVGGSYRLSLQTDGNLVLYTGGKAIWSSNTAGKGASFLAMQGDGNLVLYDSSNRPTWSSGTAGKGRSGFYLQSDGNMVLYDANSRPTWSSGTDVNTTNTPSSLSSGTILSSGSSLLSTTAAHKLSLQTDGNLVLYTGGKAIWSSNTAGKGASFLAMQGDGNLVLYDSSNRPTWSSGTAGKGRSGFYLQSDGNMVLYDANSRPTWSSGTDK